MDLVDEQDVAILEIGEECSKVARLGDHRPRGGAEADAHLAREDASDRRFAETRWAVEQHMIERLAAALRRVDEHAQILARALLADELVEALRPQRRVRILRGALGRGNAGGISGHQCECSTSSPRISTHGCLRSSHTEKAGDAK